jgi:acyl-CoA ligase (AMP-forming) (exosortase A-associated)
VTLLHEILDATASRMPANPALRYRGRVYSYEELRRRTHCVASGLAAAGVTRGDRVVVYLQNRPEVVEVALACSRLGAIFVPANQSLRLRQLAHILNDSGAKLAVLPQTALVSAGELLAQCPALTTIAICDQPMDAPLPRGELRTYDDLILAPAPRTLDTIDRDPAAILYTSGSTGRPKGVVVSHKNLVSGARVVAGYLGNTADDRLLAALPLSFDYGFSQVSSAFVVGACAVLTNYSMPAALIQEVAANDITGLAGVPTMWLHLAENEWPEKAVASVRYITNSGGALSTAVIVKLRARLRNARIFCMYGLTEAFRSTYLEPEQLATRAGSIGKAVPNQEILVLREDGTPCGPGETGELVHRGSFVTQGYWNDPELTRERFRPLPGANSGLTPELVVFSGDLVRIDEEGYLYFVARRDQQIKSLGHRVSPTEIEEVLSEVSGVVEVVAVGLPDEIYGQRIAVAVVPRAGTEGDQLAEAVRLHARVQLPTYMVPAQISVVSAIARNANGKPDRAALATELAALAVPAENERPQYGRRSTPE